MAQYQGDDNANEADVGWSASELFGVFGVSAAQPEHLGEIPRLKTRTCALERKDWSTDEDAVILETLAALGSRKDWLAAASKRLPGRTTAAVRNRWIRLAKQHQAGESRPAWTSDEDAAILDSVSVHGKQWQMIAQLMPGRSVTALRNRYRRLSQASASHGSWSREEDAAIVELVEQIGQKWSTIAAALPGRTDDAVRNRYLRLQRKRKHPAESGDGDRWGMVAQRLPGRTEDAVRNRYKRLQKVQAADQPASETAAAAGGASLRITVAAEPAAARGGGHDGDEPCASFELRDLSRGQRRLSLRDRRRAERSRAEQPMGQGSRPERQCATLRGPRGRARRETPLSPASRHSPEAASCKLARARRGECQIFQTEHLVQFIALRDEQFPVQCPQYGVNGGPPASVPVLGFLFCSVLFCPPPQY